MATYTICGKNQQRVLLVDKDKLWLNKSVFSYLRTPTMWHCPHSPAARLLLTAGRAAVDDISYLTSSQQQTHHSAYGSRMEQTDRQTDGRTPASCKCKEPAPYTMPAVPKNTVLLHWTDIQKSRWNMRLISRYTAHYLHVCRRTRQAVCHSAGARAWPR